eukprot:TRINITY_DN3471_c1_g1_i1.p1 TRINITY_DN3471_c1_g1~~TRINITY_DN3471_c1_g1_i1.p1  ORF type:complete len:113 (+),score=40.61 TRINITY_DN3471_c1_g1_i1:36-374(+)
MSVGIVASCDKLQHKLTETSQGVDDAESFYTEIYSTLENLKKKVGKECSLAESAATSTSTTSSASSASLVSQQQQQQQQQQLFDKKQLLQIKEAELEELRRQVSTAEGNISD